MLGNKLSAAFIAAIVLVVFATLFGATAQAGNCHSQALAIAIAPTQYVQAPVFAPLVAPIYTPPVQNVEGQPPACNNCAPVLNFALPVQQSYSYGNVAAFALAGHQRQQAVILNLDSGGHHHRQNVRAQQLNINVKPQRRLFQRR